ncbi:hypothetical protein LV780_18880 [Cereibacter azotoformans]|uniref:Integrase n=1 Tax=Cereibacter azotoformans TaxID=43057 RepID=A0A2T5JKC0_9RHOB|nr:hypothetical protein [Cereibacter azotoformans]AXQ95402.1 hypothetical protein D0Z66_16365 [Cereibacter sphaeroides]PTR06941.1 hypothetical protein C8J28_1452 [Cereibacter azotoformans]UIJ32367.1 hypothetical protein LV780_18880 [Cereibacter azotoformans]
MAEIITFRPRSEDCDDNLADYVAAARYLPFMAASAIVWEAPAWDLTGLAKPERAGQPPLVNFEKGRSKEPALDGAFGAFARAYVAFKIAEEFGRQRQIGKYTKPVMMMRVLAAVMQENGVAEPADITPALLDAAVDRIRAQGGDPYGVEQRAKALEWVAQALNAAGVVRVPFEWSIGRRRFAMESRLSAYDDDRNFTRDELEAVTEAFVNARTPRQQVTTAVLALLCCAPARIAEVLELPVDCDAVLDPGDGFQAGLRWWPKKGGAPQIKFIPKAMVPVVQEALARIKLHTESARRLARAVAAGEAKFVKTPKGWPFLPGDAGIRYERALMVAHPLSIFVVGRVTPVSDRVEPITYHQIMTALQGSPGRPSTSIFEQMDIRLPDGSPLIVNTHKPRHYLNTIAGKASVPPADTALWSGRKSLRQNSTYDHETAQELLARIRKARGVESLAPIPIDSETAFDIAQIKETAHTTPFGWCVQSLRQNPCQMFGECLNCTHLVCIKGAEVKLANIRRELERERQLRTRAQERIAGGLRASPRWMETFDRKIARLEQLIAILESADVVDGSPVLVARMGPTPQFDPVAPGKSLARTGMIPDRSDASDE